MFGFKEPSQCIATWLIIAACLLACCGCCFRAQLMAIFCCCCGSSTVVKKEIVRIEVEEEFQEIDVDYVSKGNYKKLGDGPKKGKRGKRKPEVAAKNLRDMSISVDNPNQNNNDNHVELRLQKHVKTVTVEDSAGDVTVAREVDLEIIEEEEGPGYGAEGGQGGGAMPPPPPPPGALTAPGPPPPPPY